MNTITEAAERLLERHQAFVLATIVSRQGSTPRTAGTRMIIADDGRTDGTIGGGALEARVIQKAVAMLSSRHLDPHSDPHPERIAFDMTESELGGMDMICGGRLEVLLEFIEAGTPAAVVFQRWREIQSGAEPCLFLTVLRFAGEQLAGVDHCLLKNRRVVYGDPQLDPAILETLAREHADAVSRRSVALGESLILIEPVLPAEVLFLFGKLLFAGFHCQICL